MNPYETGYAGMDAVGPFNSVSGTLMSIPFCIAATLIYGVPDMKRMTTYDDPTLNGLISRITLISDPVGADAFAASSRPIPRTVARWCRISA